MLPALNRHPAPEWLLSFKDVNVELPIAEILQGSVFYPASAMDGRPVQYLGGYSHSFVYVDWNIAQELLEHDLDTFRGYRVLGSRPVKKEELCFKPFQPILPEPTDRRRYLLGSLANTREEPNIESATPILPAPFVGSLGSLGGVGSFTPFALWAIYERLQKYGEGHGPERFSLLFVRGEGAATFQSLYYSNQSAPSIITLIRSDAFTGNWTRFFSPEYILARSVIQNPHGTPEYMFCEYGPNRREGQKPVPPWPWYSELKHSVAFSTGAEWLHSNSWEGRLHLWGRGPGESITS